MRFRARQAVTDGRSAYDIEVRPVGVRGFMTQSHSRNVKAGGLVRTTVGLYDRRRGAYRIVVRFRGVSHAPAHTQASLLLACSSGYNESTYPEAAG